jgi:hypothetical protein
MRQGTGREFIETSWQQVDFAKKRAWVASLWARLVDR